MPNFPNDSCSQTQQIGRDFLSLPNTCPLLRSFGSFNVKTDAISADVPTGLSRVTKALSQCEHFQYDWAPCHFSWAYLGLAMSNVADLLEAIYVASLTRPLTVGPRPPIRCRLLRWAIR